MALLESGRREHFVLGDLQAQKAVMKALGVGSETLRRLRERGLPAFNIGGRIYFDVPTLVAWILENCRTMPVSPNANAATDDAHETTSGRQQKAQV